MATTTTTTTTSFTNTTLPPSGEDIGTFLDGPAQLILLLVVFCCPIIPAGGWCWLKCIESCLNCLRNMTVTMRKFAYIPMYLCLIILLIGVMSIVLPDFVNSEQLDDQLYAFRAFIVVNVIAVLCIVISIRSTVSVLQGNVMIDSQRERTVYIIALPSFFCLMCVLSMQQLLIHKLGTLDHHWAWELHFENDQQRVQFTLSMISFYMSAADVFECFAFAFFAMLTMEALKRASRLADARGGTSREERLQKCIAKWTMSPMYMFCLVLCGEAIYNLINVFSKYFKLDSLLPPALSNSLHKINFPSEDAMGVAFFTLTSIFSSLAIMALFSIEHVFHDDLKSVDFLYEFSPRCKAFRFLENLKFWGVKIFVTAEFSMDVLERAVTMNEIDKQLINTVCMAVLCLLVAVLHIWAYNPRGRWISDKDPSSLDLEDGNQSVSAPSDSDFPSRRGSGVSLQHVQRRGEHGLPLGFVSDRPRSPLLDTIDDGSPQCQLLDRPSSFKSVSMIEPPQELEPAAQESEAAREISLSAPSSADSGAGENLWQGLSSAAPEEVVAPA